MSYCTLPELIDIFGEREIIELTNLDDPQAIAVDEAIAQRALEGATNMIDGYLQNRNNLPLSSVPQVLIDCCADIARYRLDHLRTRDDVRERFEYWMSWLKDLSRGLVNLGLDETDKTVGNAPDTVHITSGARVFTDDLLARY